MSKSNVITLPLPRRPLAGEGELATAQRAFLAELARDSAPRLSTLIAQLALAADPAEREAILRQLELRK